MLVQGMRRIGAAALVSGDQDQQARFESLFAAIDSVHWSKIDPSATIWPSRNDVAAPMYLNGDFIPWDAEAWRPMVPPKMFGGGTATERGEKYVGSLAPYRSAGSGRVLRPPGWATREVAKRGGIGLRDAGASNEPRVEHHRRVFGGEGLRVAPGQGRTQARQHSRYREAWFRTAG